MSDIPPHRLLAAFFIFTSLSFTQTPPSLFLQRHPPGSTPDVRHSSSSPSCCLLHLHFPLLHSNSSITFSSKTSTRLDSRCQTFLLIAFLLPSSSSLPSPSLK